jgi:hypothetical protein
MVKIKFRLTVIEAAFTICYINRLPVSCINIHKISQVVTVTDSRDAAFHPKFLELRAFHNYEWLLSFSFEVANQATA